MCVILQVAVRAEGKWAKVQAKETYDSASRTMWEVRGGVQHQTDIKLVKGNRNGNRQRMLLRGEPLLRASSCCTLSHTDDWSKISQDMTGVRQVYVMTYMTYFIWHDIHDIHHMS